MSRGRENISGQRLMVGTHAQGAGRGTVAMVPPLVCFFCTVEQK